jgi:hypothetical protein
MNKQERKYRLMTRLEAMGFTHEEGAALRRIEMTLQRWAERECGDGSDWAIERDETTGKPCNVYHGEGAARRYSIPDREAGALRRLAAILKARNDRVFPDTLCNWDDHPNFVTAYHQGDCRGCMLHLLTRAQLTDPQTGDALPIDQYYTRGLAVCE